jgi:hypothetical protein
MAKKKRPAKRKKKATMAGAVRDAEKALRIAERNLKSLMKKFSKIKSLRQARCSV